MIVGHMLTHTPKACKEMDKRLQDVFPVAGIFRKEERGGKEGQMKKERKKDR